MRTAPSSGSSFQGDSPENYLERLQKQRYPYGAPPSLPDDMELAGPYIFRLTDSFTKSTRKDRIPFKDSYPQPESVEAELQAEIDESADAYWQRTSNWEGTIILVSYELAKPLNDEEVRRARAHLESLEKSDYAQTHPVAQDIQFYREVLGNFQQWYHAHQFRFPEPESRTIQGRTADTTKRLKQAVRALLPQTDETPEKYLGHEDLKLFYQDLAQKETELFKLKGPRDPASIGRYLRKQFVGTSSADKLKAVQAWAYGTKPPK